MLAFGGNSMGAHFNHVTLTTANLESRTAYQHCFEAAEVAFFNLYKSTRICTKEDCSFCNANKEQAGGNLLKEYLKSLNAQRDYYHIDKRSSDQ